MQQHGGILADRIEHDRLLGGGDRLPEDVDRFGLELLEMRQLDHARTSMERRARACRRRRHGGRIPWQLRLPTTSGRPFPVRPASPPACRARSRWRGSPAHGACSPAGPRLGEGCDRLAAPPASGLSFRSPRSASAARIETPPRAADWSALSPVTQTAAARKRTRERRDLAHLAAGLARRHALAKTIDALAPHQRLGIGRVRIDRPDARAVAQLRLRPDRMGLREEPARVERDDVDRELLRQDQMRDDLILEGRSWS